MGTQDSSGNIRPGEIGRQVRETCQAVTYGIDRQPPPHESMLGTFLLYVGVFAIVCGLFFWLMGSEPLGCGLVVGFGVVFVGVGQMLRLLQRILRHVWLQTQALESSKNPFLHQGIEDGTGPGQHDVADD